MENIFILREVEAELKRFTSKLENAIEEQTDNKTYSTKDYAAAKRSALDLKRELTKLTQDSIYKYGKRD